MEHGYIEAHEIRARYAAGRLTPAEEQEFEVHLVDCLDCIRAVECEVGLREGLRLSAAQRPPASTAAPAVNHRFLQLAALLLLATSVGLAVSLVRSTAALRSARVERDETQRRAAEAERSAAERIGAQEQQRASQAAAPPAAALVPAAVFALATVRGSIADEPINRIGIDRNTRIVVFTLELPIATRSGAYKVSLSGRDRRVLWTGGPFPPPSTDTLAVGVEPALIPDGDYVLELRHESANGSQTPVGHYSFRVAASR